MVSEAEAHTSKVNVSKDRTVLRDLVKQYLEICHDPSQKEKKKLWKDVHALTSEQPAVLLVPNLMIHEVPEVHELHCENECLRGIEKEVRQQLFLSKVGDDRVFEPFLNLGAVFKDQNESLWGFPINRQAKQYIAENMYESPPIKKLEDSKDLRAAPEEIDEAETKERQALVEDAVGDLIPINVVHRPRYAGRGAFLIPDLTLMRGMTQLMLDMHDNPEWLHEVLAFMRDTVLASFEKAENAGNWKRTDTANQAMPYAYELPDPQANCTASLNELWGFFHAQEYTLVSPDMHEEFSLRYQRPIMEKFGLTAYGCCEDLTEKIDMLRTVPNLRRIAVTPRADVVKCAERIGRDYTISWRPNPTDMICCGFDEDKIERKLTEGVQALKGLHYDITLKDVVTVEHDLSRLTRWVNIARRVIDKVYGG